MKKYLITLKSKNVQFTKLTFALIILQFTFHYDYGQELTLEDGSFKFIIQQRVLTLQFTYDSLQVGKYKIEADYVNKKVTEMNKKYPGKGDEWEKEWIAQRKEKFEPAFTEAFKKSSGLNISDSSGYTLIFHTTFIEQGFSSAGILVHKNPEVRGELLLFKNSDKDRIIAKAKITKAMGKAGPHFETGDHVDEAYSEAGNASGAFILNN